MNSILSQILVAVGTAVITAPLAVWLSMRRFYAEKLWERKLSAYTAIIEALHQLAYPFNDLEELAPKRGQALSKERREELWKKHAAAYGEIRKQVDVGELVLPAKAIRLLDETILERLRSDDLSPKDFDSENFARTITLQIRSIYYCLDEIKKIAKRDLRMTRAGWLPSAFRRLS